MNEKDYIGHFVISNDSLFSCETLHSSKEYYNKNTIFYVESIEEIDGLLKMSVITMDFKRVRIPFYLNEGYIFKCISIIQ